jgi:catechol 2,3-dioxygenase-like lactoylglutathione lyase family enzyme
MLSGFHHVKVPVSDVERSRDWYERVLGLQRDLEFVENGELMGVTLRDAGGTVCVGLRREPERAAALKGFAPVSLNAATRGALDAWCRRLERLGESHGGVHPAYYGHVLVGLHDPDGIEIRIYTEDDGT